VSPSSNNRNRYSAVSPTMHYQTDQVQSQDSNARHPGIVPSPDFRSVVWDRNVKFSFTPTQAGIVDLLYQAYQARIPEVGQDWLILRCGSRARRLLDIFRQSHLHGKMHPAWGTMIRSGSTRGTYRLVSSVDAEAEQIDENAHLQHEAQRVGHLVDQLLFPGHH